MMNKVGESLFDTCWKRWVSEIHPEDGFIQKVYDDVEQYEATYDARMRTGVGADPYLIFTHVVSVWYDWWLEQDKYRLNTASGIGLGNIDNTADVIVPF